MPIKELTLTIVIPAYNEEGYLVGCLDSIAKQSVKPDEVLVVDNNSIDKTIRIAKRYKFAKVLHEPSQGVVYARNQGFNAAKSDIVARIDADSHLPKDWVKNVKAEFSDESIAAITGPAGGYDMPVARLNWLAHHLLCTILTHLPTKQPFLFGFNMALRRSTWQKVRAKTCRDNLTHEDLDLAIHLASSPQKIKYTSRIRLSASGRRFNSTWSDFHFYMRTYATTYHRHGIYNWTVYLAVLAYYLGYVLYWPWTAWRPSRHSPVG